MLCGRSKALDSASGQQAYQGLLCIQYMTKLHVMYACSLLYGDFSQFLFIQWTLLSLQASQGTTDCTLHSIASIVTCSSEFRYCMSLGVQITDGVFVHT